MRTLAGFGVEIQGKRQLIVKEHMVKASQTGNVAEGP